MKYLIMDIEWSNTGQQQIMQLGACVLDEQYQNKGQYYKRVCPPQLGRIKDYELRIQHLERKALAAAPAIREVVENLIKWLETYDDELILVVWNKESSKVLKQQLRYLGVRKLFRKVLIMQELIKTVFLEKESEEQISFLEACHLYHIHVDRKRMHHARYDITVLTALFIHFMVNLELYETEYVRERREYHTADAPYKIHTKGCHKQENEEKRVHTKLYDGIAEGYMPCKRCMDVKIETIRDEKGKLLFKDPHLIIESYIHYLGKKYGYKMHVVGEQVLIKGPFSKWLLELKEDKVEAVYHGNYGGNKYNLNSRKFLQQYHKQRIRIVDLDEVMQYIHCHDHSLKYGSDHKKAHGRIDELFKMIAVDESL